MVDCSQFREGYSDYRDGELAEGVRARFEAHRAECAACARYDRLIADGVEHYRRCPAPTLSEDFLPRLQHRLYHLEEEMRAPARNGSGTQALVTLALAASLAAIAWMPALRSVPPTLELPPVAARAPLPPPAPAPVSFPDDPFPDAPFRGVTPAGLGGWRIDSEARGAGLLLTTGAPAGAEFFVQPAMQR